MKGFRAIPAFVGAVLLAACGETPNAARLASSRTALTSPPELLANEPRETLKKMYDELLLSAQAEASARVVPEKFVLIQGNSLSAAVPESSVDLFAPSDACQNLQLSFNGARAETSEVRQRSLGNRTEEEAARQVLCSYLTHLGMNANGKIDVGLVTGISSAIIYVEPTAESSELAVARVNRALLYLAFAASASR
jgi:hypothetical protein